MDTPLKQKYQRRFIKKLTDRVVELYPEDSSERVRATTVVVFAGELVANMLDEIKV
jgi:hypothetical protein